MTLYPILVATILPCLLFIALIHHFSSHKEVSTLLRLKLLGAGFIAPVAAVFIEFITFKLCDYFPDELVIPARAFLGIAVIEEGLKLAVILMIVKKRRDFNEFIDGPIYAITAAMGFAIMENLMYVFGSQAPMAIAIMRGITAVPLHALAGGFMGLAITSEGIKPIHRIGGTFLIAVLIHGFYDWFLMDDRIADYLIFPLLVIGWLILGWLLGRGRKQDVESS